jgi:hypothetical protein
MKHELVLKSEGHIHINKNKNGMYDYNKSSIKHNLPVLHPELFITVTNHQRFYFSHSFFIYQWLCAKSP